MHWRGCGWMRIANELPSLQLTVRLPRVSTTWLWSRCCHPSGLFGFIHFVEIHALRFSAFPIRHCSSDSSVIQSKKHLASTALQRNEQESLDKRLAISYKSADLPVLHRVNVPYQNDSFINRARERFPGLCFMFYVELVPGRAPWHDACHTSFDGVKYAHGLTNWLTDQVMTVSLKLALYPPRYHISWCHHLWGLSKDGCRPCILAWLGLKVWHCWCFEDVSARCWR